MEPIILVGAGGHAKVVIETIRAAGTHDIVGITDLADNVGSDVLGVPVVGTDDVLADWLARGVRLCLITAGSTGYPALRARLAATAASLGFEFAVVAHPSAVLSPSARLAAGVFVGPGAIVNADARVDAHAIVNSGAIVEHDCAVGELAHLSPGVHMSGGSSVGPFTHVGTGSSLVHGVSIGANSLIGAGSVVTENIGDGVVAYGSPCRVVRQQEIPDP
jgi:sugar O-acyltransferase (sialic acid O-acetyltransferase NeuD family)